MNMIMIIMIIIIQMLTESKKNRAM